MNGNMFHSKRLLPTAKCKVRSYIDAFAPIGFDMSRTISGLLPGNLTYVP